MDVWSHGCKTARQRSKYRERIITSSCCHPRFHVHAYVHRHTARMLNRLAQTLARHSCSATVTRLLPLATSLICYLPTARPTVRQSIDACSCLAGWVRESEHRARRSRDRPSWERVMSRAIRDPKRCQTRSCRFKIPASWDGLWSEEARPCKRAKDKPEIQGEGGRGRARGGSTEAQSVIQAVSRWEWVSCTCMPQPSLQRTGLCRRPSEGPGRERFSHANAQDHRWSTRLCMRCISISGMDDVGDLLTG